MIYLKTTMVMNFPETEDVMERCGGCLLCEGHLDLLIKDAYDTRFGIKRNYGLAICMACSTIQLSFPPLLEQLNSLYEKYYNLEGLRQESYSRMRSGFLQSLFYHIWLNIDGDISFHKMKGSRRLLDVGCNEGRGLKIYQQNGYTVEGLDLNETAAAEARKAGFRTYTDPLEQFEPEKPYDVIVLSNVIEHSLDPKDMLNHVNRILEPGGQVWISCPNVDSWQRSVFGKYWINWHVPFHIVHFSQKTLTNILEKAGFEIQEVRQESPALWLAHSIIVRMFAQFGQPTRQLRNPFLVATLMILIRTLFFPLLWLGNSLGRGDCLVVVAQKVPK